MLAAYGVARGFARDQFEIRDSGFGIRQNRDTVKMVNTR